MNQKQKDVHFVGAEELGFDPVQNTFGAAMRGARQAHRRLGHLVQSGLWIPWPSLRQMVKPNVTRAMVMNGRSRRTGNER